MVKVNQVASEVAIDDSVDTMTQWLLCAIACAVIAAGLFSVSRPLVFPIVLLKILVLEGVPQTQKIGNHW